MEGIISLLKMSAGVFIEALIIFSNFMNRC